MPIVRIVIGAVQQFAGACCGDDVGNAITPHLRALGIERHPEMQLLAGVSVDRAEQCRVGQIEISLIERNLRAIAWKFFFETVLSKRAPIFRAQRLAFPDKRIIEIDPIEGVGSADDDAVDVTRKSPFTAEKARASGGANLKPVAMSCLNVRASK